VALAAQGFADPRPTGSVTMRHLRRVVSRIGVLQIDSVNVLQRAHYLPLFSRLGPYPTDLLDRAAYRAPRVLFEYWGHVASLLPVELHPLMRWRMATAHDGAWAGMLRVAREQPELVARVLAEVRDRGPVTAAEVEQDAVKPTGNWGWNWSDVKTALEWLFRCGEVTVARRNGSFARVYDVPERVLPASVLAAPTPSRADAIRELVARSAAALGVAAETELRDYYRLPVDGFRTAVAELVEAGVLRPVTVEGWKPRAYLHVDARIPRRVPVCTLVSPFDPLVWERSRSERLFGFRYRIGIYTPPEQRVHGYYALPFLWGEQIVARVDLKLDRRGGVLQIPGVWCEPGHDAEEVAPALATALEDLATWLGAGDIAAPEQGDLAKQLARTLGERPAVTV